MIILLSTAHCLICSNSYSRLTSELAGTNKLVLSPYLNKMLFWESVHVTFHNNIEDRSNTRTLNYVLDGGPDLPMVRGNFGGFPPHWKALELRAIAWNCVCSATCITEPWMIHKFYNLFPSEDVPHAHEDKITHLGCQKSPKSYFGAWIGIFRSNRYSIKTAILSKLLHRLQPNFVQR